MLRRGILNPAINSLLSRVRHTNTLAIADRGFPFWPQVETIDISLVDDIPAVLDVLRAISANFVIGRAYMAREFQSVNSEATRAALAAVLGATPVVWEPHEEFKLRIPRVIGLIRTADTVQYANIVIESA